MLLVITTPGKLEASVVECKTESGEVITVPQKKHLFPLAQDCPVNQTPISAIIVMKQTEIMQTMCSFIGVCLNQITSLNNDKGGKEK